MTVPITIDVALVYLKSDGDDADLITSQIASATNVCEDYCNRKFYADWDALEADFTLALSDRLSSLLSRTQLLAGVDTDDESQRRIITDHYDQVLARISQRLNGIVLDDAINAAIFITLGHLYVNREDNLATGNNVVQVPVGAQRILQSKLWIGDLVGTDCDYTPQGS